LPRKEIFYNSNSIMTQFVSDSGEGDLTARLDRLALLPDRLQGSRSDRMVNPV
jgi:hypothetical protein